MNYSEQQYVKGKNTVKLYCPNCRNVHTMLEITVGHRYEIQTQLEYKILIYMR